MQLNLHVRCNGLAPGARTLHRSYGYSARECPLWPFYSFFGTWGVLLVARAVIVVVVIVVVFTRRQRYTPSLCPPPARFPP